MVYAHLTFTRSSRQGISAHKRTTHPLFFTPRQAAVNELTADPAKEAPMTHPELIAAMSRPEFYPHRPEAITVLQTHISFIFIAGGEVYKVKKAVDFAFLDFTTLEKRKFYCEEELRLNRRLAPEAYLGVVPIAEDASGRLAFGANGRIVEYAVRMRKLPQERMLGRLLAEGKVELAVMDAIAGKLADFHRRAETGDGSTRSAAWRRSAGTTRRTSPRRRTPSALRSLRAVTPSSAPMPGIF